MGIGLTLIRAIIDEGARTTVSELTESLFVGDSELNAFTFFANHYRRHGSIATRDTMLSNGFRLPSATEPSAYYLERCRDRAKYNTLVELQGRIPNLIRAKEIDEAIDLMREAISETNLLDVSSSVISINTAFQQIGDGFEEEQFRDGLRGVTLGYDFLDRITEGAQGGDVIIMAARPNVGKSYILLQQALAAWRAGNSIMFASMEMTIPQVSRRLLGMTAGLGPDYIRRGELSSWGIDLMHETIASADNMPPFHFVSGDLRKSVGQIDALIQEYSPDIIYIDAGYLLSPDKNKVKDRREKISDVAEELKAVALDRNRPIVTTVQMNRQGIYKKKTGQRGKTEEPGTEHLAESDVLGQIATVVALIYPPSENARDKRVINISKNRDGPLAKFLVNFNFNPIDFSFIREWEDVDMEEDGAEAMGSLEDSW